MAGNDLSDRDVLSLALFALVELDERILESRRNSINFSRCMMESKNRDCLVQVAEETLPEMDRGQLLDYAMQRLEELKAKRLSRQK